MRFRDPDRRPTNAHTRTTARRPTSPEPTEPAEPTEPRAVDSEKTTPSEPDPAASTHPVPMRGDGGRTQAEASGVAVVAEAAPDSEETAPWPCEPNCTRCTGRRGGRPYRYSTGTYWSRDMPRPSGRPKDARLRTLRSPSPTRTPPMPGSLRAPRLCASPPPSRHIAHCVLRR